MDGQIRFEYVWTSGRGLKVRSHCHFDKVWEGHSCDNGKEICQKVRCTFRFFFLFISAETFCMFFFYFRVTFAFGSSSPVALPCKTTIDMRRFGWKADDLMGKGRRKRRPQLLTNREARIWKQLNLLSWMLAAILSTAVHLPSRILLVNLSPAFRFPTSFGYMQSLIQKCSTGRKPVIFPGYITNQRLL